MATQELDIQSIFEAALEQALYVSPLAAGASKVLGNLGSASAQRALVRVASASAMPIETRRQASAAFVASVQRRGIGLTISEMQRLGKLYQQQSIAEQESEEVMWSLLDALQNVE